MQRQLEAAARTPLRALGAEARRLLAGSEARAQERAENPAPAPAYYTVLDIGSASKPQDPEAVAAAALLPPEIPESCIIRPRSPLRVEGPAAPPASVEEGPARPPARRRPRPRRPARASATRSRGGSGRPNPLARAGSPSGSAPPLARRFRGSAEDHRAGAQQFLSVLTSNSFPSKLCIW